MMKLSNMLVNMGLSPMGGKAGPIKQGISAIGHLFKWFFEDQMRLSKVWAGSIIAVLAMVLLFAALWLLVKMLRSLMQGRLSGMFNKALFRNPATAFVVGIVMTATVQSSSVTISMIVPLVGTEILQLAQVFPYLLGANIGTTVTAMLAALSTGSPQAIACACGHLLFNSYGTIVFWPLKVIPITMAQTFGDIAARRRLVAIGFVLALFFLLPAGVLLIMKWAG
jgi:sodium-dependent phosphate cotransporter